MAKKSSKEKAEEKVDLKPLKSSDKTTAKTTTNTTVKTKAEPRTTAKKPAVSWAMGDSKPKGKFGLWWERVWDKLTFYFTWFKSACGIRWRQFKEESKTKKFRIIASLVLVGVIAVTSVLTYFLAFMPRGILPIGMNISTNNYYSRQMMFSDVFLSASTVRGAGGTWEEGVIPVDEKGYPLEVPFEGRQAIFMFNNYYVGDYVLLFEGDGEFSGSESVEIIKHHANRVDLKLTHFERERFITIVRSNVDNPIKNIRIIPREWVGKEGKMPLFNKAFLDGLDGMHAIRFMDAVKTNSSTQVNWEDRSKVGDFSMAKNGIPYEYLIDLCNKLKVDGWFNVPHMASDDYITNLATLIKSRLNKKLTAYIEYSNEVWNGDFPAATYVDQNAPDAVDEYVSEDLAEIGAAGTERHIKAAYMMSRTFRLFEEVFTGKDRKRLVTVGAVHSVNTWTLPQVTAYWKKHNEVPDAIAGTAYFGYETSASDDASIPQSVIPRADASELNAYFHNLWNGNPLVTKDAILDAVESIYDYKVVPNVYQASAIIRSTGARYFVYEGGQHMQPHNQGEWSYNDVLYQTQLSPRMYDLYMRNFKLQAEVGCELFMNFSYVSANESRYGSWGVLNSVDDVYAKKLKTVSPKYKAVRDANSRNGLVNN